MSSPPGDPGTSPLDSVAEGLFGFGTDTWTARLKQAHQKPAPSRLGPYEILGELGRGGQGEVYRAVQPGTGRIVAIKRISGLGLSPDPALLVRFTREVEALTRLSHPNVVTVHTVDAVDNHTILVMELVEGRTIDLWADSQWAAAPEPLKQVLSTFARACDGVAHAHQRGVIHRDIKPNNILVAGDGQPKVLDFGIARLLNEQAAAGAAPAWTITGFAGTPAYASPEQLSPRDGRGVDTRSDVYSLGVLLFRMLTGQEAFDPALGLVARVKSADDGPVRAPSRIRPRLPAECDWIVRKATDPEPERRYQSVDAFVDDVRRLIDGRAVLAHPPSVAYTISRAVRRRPYLTTAIVGAIFAISALGIVTAIQAARLSIKNEQLGKAVSRAEAGESTAKTEAAAHAEAVAAVTEAIYSLTFQIAYNPYLHRADAANAFVKAMEPRADRLPPESRMRFHERLWHLAETTRDHGKALIHAQKAIDACLQTTGESRRIESKLRLGLSFTFRKLGKSKEGLAEARRAHEVASADFGPTSREAIAAHTDIAFCIAETDLNAGIAEARRAKSIAAVSSPVDAAEAGLHIVPWLTAAQRPQEAVREGLADIAVLDKAGVGSRKVTLMLKYKVAEAHVDLGQITEAAELLEFVVKVRATRDPVTYIRRLEAVRLYAETLVRLARYQESVPHFEQAIGVDQTASPRGQRLARLRFLLAAAYSGMGKHDQARPFLYLAASRGSHDGAREGSGKFDADVKLLTDAIKAGAGRIDQSLNDRLGKFAWMGLTAPKTSAPVDPDDEPGPDEDFSTPDPL